jgi:uncharacterized membrane protein YpjA
MNSLKLAVSYGVLTWALPFILSVLIFFLHSTERPLFESIMAVTLVLVVVFLTNLYFKNHERNLREGIFLGILWLVINLSFDFLFFIAGPGKMTPDSYIKDIGLTYLIIPIITVGFTYKNPANKEIDK